MVTEFGKFMRILRITHNVTAKELAGALEASTSYLSAVENGNRSIPMMWEQKIIKFFELEENDCERLRYAISNSSTTVKLDLSEVEGTKKQLLMSIARDDIDDEALQKAMEIIKNSTTRGGK